jgi:rhodanese-related sulfurtransferase
MRQRIPFQCIDAHAAEDLVQRNDALVLDVRDAKSFARAHIENAQQLSMINLSGFIDGAAKGRPVLIYCYHGYASREYAQIFSDFGFAEVYSLDGGYEAWSNRPHPAGNAILNETLKLWLAEQQFPPDDVDAVISNGTTPLMKASHNGEGNIVRMLIAAGAQLDARNADGNNALLLACVGGHLDIIDLLLEVGIDINNRNDNGATPLMYAASSGKACVVERLLAKGADATPETLDGFTAVDLASTVECLTLLRRASRRGSGAAGSGAPLETAPLNP